jgi:PAS domain S-box-containing protein
MDDQHQLATKESLAAIVESSDDAILSKDLNGIIRSCNAATERIFGYTSEELVGQPVRILIPPERQTEEDDIMARIRRGERTDHFETVRVTKDRRSIDVSLTISPIYGPSGAIIGASKIVRDITERKQLARELAAQQESFRVTLSSIGDGVIASDERGYVTFLNPCAEELTGWSAGEAAGQPLGEVFRIINEKTRQRVENPAGLVMRTGHVVGLANHTVLLHRDGSERPIADSAAPIRDEAGKPIGAVLVFRDVTDERRAEDAVAEQREWFETTLESIGDAVIATDVQGHVVFMNPIAEHLTGWSLDGARGRSCVDVFRIINEESRRTVENPVSRVLAEGVTVGLANHTTLIAADGTERPIDDSGAPIRNRSGRIVGVVLVFRDITERRRIDAERRNVADERERLLNAERAARADAERASRVKDDFVAMVSHELRTPLNAILGWTELMMQSAQDQDVIARGLDVISRNTRVQAQLVSDLLDVSRIASGKLRLTIEKVDLVSLVRNVIETVQQAANSKHISVRAEIEAEAIPIAGDPARLQQIVWNLLWNAIKFTPAGGNVLVRVRDSAADAEISVTDTGVGIKAEVLPHIFERFNQANLLKTGGLGGLGLGLSIVKHLVDLHGGSIKADSPGEGLGATFMVVLPSGELPEIAEVSAGPRKSPAPQDVLQGLSILVVEDEADTRDFLGRFLATHGAKVVITGSAEEALARLPEADADLLISDIGLPEVDGYELLQRIRQTDAAEGGGIPAIALTAYARAEDRARAFRAGYQAHLAKPIEPTDLLTAIARIAQSAERRDESRGEGSSNRGQRKTDE